MAVALFSGLPNEMKYSPRTDYRRKRGLIEEINRSIQSVERDSEVLRGLGQRQSVTEGAIDYAPAGIDSPDREPTAPPAPAPGTPAPPKDTK